LETIGDHLLTKRLDEGKYLREVAKEIEVPGEQLRHFRRVHGLTQSDLADQLRVDVHTIGRIERNSGSYSKTEERVIKFLED
jgi:DNA-binding XRE family transcriptional regulator